MSVCVASALGLCWVERVLAKIDPRTMVSSLLLSTALIVAYAIIGILAGGWRRVVYDLSLPIFWLLFWAVIYVTGRHCRIMRMTVRWITKVGCNTNSRGQVGFDLCAYFEEKVFGKWSTLVGALTYLVSVAYFLVFTISRTGWRLTELPYNGGFALGIPLTSVPLLLASELFHWALIRAVSTTSIWLALASVVFLYKVSRDIPMRFTEFDHWEMKPLVDSAWSISYSLGVAGFFLLAWLPLLIVSALGASAINTALALGVAVMYGFFALGISVWVLLFVRDTLASAKREVLSNIYDRLWKIYQDLRTGGKGISGLSDRELEELNVEVVTLEKIGADVERKTVFPLSLGDALRLLFSPVIYPSATLLREYLRSVYGF